MIREIAFTFFLGFPLIAYTGFLTLFLMLFTATVGYLSFRGYRTIPFKWHPRLAIITIGMAIIHMVMGLSILLRF
jgi:hypothetical protein